MGSRLNILSRHTCRPARFPTPDLNPRTVSATATGLASDEQLKAWSQGLELASEQIDKAKREGTFVNMDTQVAAMLMAATYRVYLQAWLELDGAQPIDDLVESLIAQLKRSFFRARRAAPKA